MPAGAAIFIVAMFIAMDAVVIGALVWIFKDSFARPLVRAFPSHAAKPDAVTRKFQSFAFDHFSLGCCVHAAVDDEFLHLHPAAIARLCGMTPISIPWSAITLRPSRAKSRYLKADLRAETKSWSLHGPRWCLELAAPPAA